MYSKWRSVEFSNSESECQKQSNFTKVASVKCPYKGTLRPVVCRLLQKIIGIVIRIIGIATRQSSSAAVQKESIFVPNYKSEINVQSTRIKLLISKSVSPIRDGLYLEAR